MAEKVGMDPKSVIFTDKILKYIIKNYTHRNTQGMRSLRKAIQQIFMKLNILRYKDIDPAVLGDSYIPNIKFPLKITTSIVTKLLIDLDVAE